MKTINDNVKVSIWTDSEGYQKIDFTSYSSNKVSPQVFIDVCINTLLDIKNDMQPGREKRKWYQFWKSNSEE